MSQDNKVFEDFMKLAGSAMGTAFNSASEMKNQFNQTVNAQIEEFLAKHDLVTREEFEVVKEMAAKAAQENKELLKRIEKLEK